jgi:class 3 adenylate cyclase/tetratricopeptide (TPR) repeat protein
MTTERRRERKVVTVVFCDLVGFTQRAESLDPEDVEAILRPYHARVRAELERHGGTVEKFIGDAVMALFGAPVAHEDDPERAVRAALAIRDFALGEGLELRVGITTGEVLVSLDASPAEGEGMASGDVVNTAARLQSVAPVNGVLADGPTHRATRQAIEWASVAAVEVKGKSQPIEVWTAVQARSRFGVDVAHEARAELVGRDRELTVLRDAFDRARHERTPQLVTLVGVPGIGKSRLVYELSRIADADPEIITWRQGRCLAYGDGVTLWALGEIVKAQAGVLEQDSPSDVTAKIGRAVADALPDSGEALWVESNVLALVGLGEEAELGGNRRAAFAAWRRFLEALAEQRPLVLVFEDLHWADEGLLDFVDELVEWVTDVPLLVVGTARPELLERRPGWGGGKLNATTLALAPLGQDQTALLLGRLLEKPVLEAETQLALLERAGGNPLYAEQFADLYLERGSTDELPLPETLQGIIAARLDGLRGREKDLLQDAAVVGKVFWASALRSAENDTADTLHALERKGFVRRQKRSSLEGESEFAFAHALVRDVAYGQIARADRAERHRRTAAWIEALGRPADHAEMLAHHWRAALDLSRAAGEDEGGLIDKARLALREAGERAFGLNTFPAAERYFGDALELWPDADPGRPELLFKRARALHFAGDERRARALEEARDALLAGGDRETAAEAEAYLAHGAWYRGSRDSAQRHMSSALELVASAEASIAKARVLAFSARFRMLAGDTDEAIRIANDALAIAEPLELDELRAHALATRGSAKRTEDPAAGAADVQEALRIALEARSPVAGAIANNLAVLATWGGEIARAAQLYDEALDIAMRFGDMDGLRFTRGNVIVSSFFLGLWDEALAAADEFIAECETSPHYQEGALRNVRAYMRLARGDSAGALDDASVSLAQAREIEDPQRLLSSLLNAARVHGLLGHRDEALGPAKEAIAFVREHIAEAGILGQISIVAGELGLRAELLELLDRAPSTPWVEVAKAGISEDYPRAREIFAAFGTPALEAEACLLAGEKLIRSGRREEGLPYLEDALAFYRGVGATAFVRRAEALLPASA